MPTEVGAPVNRIKVARSECSGAPGRTPLTRYLNFGLNCFGTFSMREDRTGVNNAETQKGRKARRHGGTKRRRGPGGGRGGRVGIAGPGCGSLRFSKSRRARGNGARHTYNVPPDRFAAAGKQSLVRESFLARTQGGIRSPARGKGFRQESGREGILGPADQRRCAARDERSSAAGPGRKKRSHKADDGPAEPS